MDATKLRKKVLQLAFEGKLISNDNILSCEGIKAKYDSIRNNLIATKKIKKEKYSDDILDEEKLFKSPNNWIWDRLGNIGNWGAGATPLRSNSLFYDNGTIPWLKTGELNNGYIDKTEEYITEKALKECSLKIVNPGDVMIAMYGATIGKLGIANIKLTTNQACCSCRLYYGVNSKYLFFYLMALKDYFINEGIGGAQPNISRELIVNTPICIPPIEYQSALCDKIETIFSYIDQLERSSNTIKSLKNKLKGKVLDLAFSGKLMANDDSLPPFNFNEISKIKEEKINKKLLKPEKNLSDITIDEIPYEIPKNWKWIRLGNYVEKVTDQVASGSFASLRENVKSLKTEDYALMVKIADFSNNFTKDLTYTDERGYNYLKNSNLFGGELILSNVGSVGKIYIVPELNMKMTLAPNSVMIKFISDEHRDYIYNFLKSPQGYNEIMNITTGTAVPKFNKTDLKNILLPIPPLEEQKRIVERIDYLTNLIDLL